MYTIIRKHFVTVLILAVVGGCAQQPTETIKLFDDLAAVNKPYERLLIVDVSIDSTVHQIIIF